jgi:hypothetical protein
MFHAYVKVNLLRKMLEFKLLDTLEFTLDNKPILMVV